MSFIDWDFKIYCIVFFIWVIIDFDRFVFWYIRFINGFIVYFGVCGMIVSIDFFFYLVDLLNK